MHATSCGGDGSHDSERGSPYTASAESAVVDALHELTLTKPQAGSGSSANHTYHEIPRLEMHDTGSSRRLSRAPNGSENDTCCVVLGVTVTSVGESHEVLGLMNVLVEGGAVKRSKRRMRGGKECGCMDHTGRTGPGR